MSATTAESHEGPEIRTMQDTSAATLEFPRLRTLVAGMAHSAIGRDLLESLEPSCDAAWLAAEHVAVQEASALLRAGAGAQLGALRDTRPELEHSRIDGTALEGEQLRAIATLARMTNAWASVLLEPPTELACGLPELKRRAGRLALPEINAKLRALSGAIDTALEPDGTVSESASPGLRRVRREIERQQRSIADSLRATLRRLSAEGSAQNDVVTVRGDRFVIGVKVEQKRRLPGVIHGASSSGQTVFVEPLETIEQNNELVRLREEELEEIRRVLAELTRRTGEVWQELAEAVEILAEGDSLLARARFSLSYGCVSPRLGGSGDNGETLLLREARHPLLEERLRRNGGASVPLSVTFAGDARQLIISGPNTGGKTVGLKTIGLLALMAQAGFPVPAEEARLPMFSAVLADIGDAQSIERNLSTFSSHVTNIAHIAETVRDMTAADRALVLFDEIGSATDPEEGAALAVATAEHFLAPGVWSVISTHFTAMKVYATNRAGVINAAVGFNEETFAPTYRLRVGVPGASAGIRMAERLGLDAQIVSAARRKLGTQTEEIAAFLERLHRELDTVAEERAALRKAEQEVARERNRLELQGREEQRQKVRELERTLQELVRDMEFRVRENVRAVEDKAAQHKISKEAERRLARQKREFEEQFNNAAVAARSGADRGDPNARPHLVTKVVPGDRVKLRSVGRVVRVEREIDANTLEVSMGNIKMRVARADIAEVVPEGVAALSPLEAARGRGIRVRTSAPEDAAPSLEINVIGQTADEAEHTVERFIDRAFLGGAPRVRVVHGTGMGILRRTLRVYLKNHPHVASVTEAAQNEGGQGATIVELRQ